MSDFQNMPGIGPVLAGRLEEAGISCVEDLKKTGVKPAFLRVRTLYPDACLMSLYALAGAVQGKQRGLLSDEEKADLKAFFHAL